MKIVTVRFLLLGCLALAIGMGTVRAETPTEAVDRIWNAWDFAHGQPSANAPKDMVAFNKTIAREQGVAVIAPIMIRSKDWKGEEGMIFVTLIAFLPRAQTVTALGSYKKTGKPWEQQAATDFLIELDSRDVKQMVKQYSTQ